MALFYGVQRWEWCYHKALGVNFKVNGEQERRKPIEAMREKKKAYKLLFDQAARQGVPLWRDFDALTGARLDDIFGNLHFLNISAWNDLRPHSIFKSEAFLSLELVNKDWTNWNLINGAALLRLRQPP